MCYLISSDRSGKSLISNFLLKLNVASSDLRKYNRPNYHVRLRRLAEPGAGFSYRRE